MRKLIVFNHISLDGYFVGENGDSSWAHAGSDDPEFAAFTSDNAKGDAEFLFGRVTYELMASFWPTPVAQQQMPIVAKAMNETPKMVFSRTLTKVSWQNTQLMKGDLIEVVRKRKSERGPAIIVFGSGTLVAQLAGNGLVDEYQIIVNPVAIGKGRTMFDGLGKPLNLKLNRVMSFKNGKTFLQFEK
jgi:dihydrofolate reductase